MSFGQPLDGGGSAAQRLVESGAVDWPPARHGNRFVSGWRPMRRGGLRWLVPREGPARLEWIHLGDGPHRLQLDLERGDGQLPRAVTVAVAGRRLGDFPVTDPLTLTLPADLPLGKVWVDLTFDDPPEERSWGVVAAALSPAAPAGETRREGESWLQSGWSALDLYLQIERGTALVGWFDPPANARREQRFELVVESADGERLGGFVWRSTLWSRWRGPRPIRVPLRDYRGLLRVRLLATGEGPPGAWRGLLVGESAPAPAPPSPVALAPPRLVVLYVLDALRADHVGYLGDAAARTPTLDFLAAQGVRFRNHWSVAPNTLPATKALLTGELPLFDESGKLPSDGPPTLAERIREVGFRTVLVSGNVYVGPAFGTARGFTDYVAVEPARNAGRSPRAINDHAERVHAAALRWLDGLRPGERAFLYLHVLNPHNPYAPPADFVHDTGRAQSEIDGSTATLVAIRQRRRAVSADDEERLRALYRGGVAYADAALGDFLAQLERRVPADELFLAVTADHGEELFDHGGVLHGNTLYDEQLHIPLVLWAPGRLAPRSVETATHTLDLHRTLLDVTGARSPSGAPGENLWQLGPEVERSRPAHLAAAVSLKGGIFAARSRRLKLIWAPRTGLDWGMGEGLGRSRDAEYLFALDADPLESVNRAGEPLFEAEWLRGALDVWLASNRPGSTAAAADEPQDAETVEQLKALGYLQ